MLRATQLWFQFMAEIGISRWSAHTATWVDWGYGALVRCCPLTSSGYFAKLSVTTCKCTRPPFHLDLCLISGGYLSYLLSDSQLFSSVDGFLFLLGLEINLTLHALFSIYFNQFRGENCSCRRRSISILTCISLSIAFSINFTIFLGFSWSWISC